MTPKEILDYIAATHGELSYSPTPIKWEDSSTTPGSWTFGAGTIGTHGKTIEDAVQRHWTAANPTKEMLISDVKDRIRHLRRHLNPKQPAALRKNVKARIKQLQAELKSLLKKEVKAPTNVHKYQRGDIVRVIREAHSDNRPVEIQFAGLDSCRLAEPRGGFTIWNYGDIELVIPKKKKGRK